MKRLLVLLMAGIITFGATACGENTSKADSSADADVSSQSSEVEKSETDEIALIDVINHEVSPESDFEFSVNEEGVCGVASYAGSDSIVVIPDTWEKEGLPVEKIDTLAFDQGTVEKAIKLPETVVEIEETAFILNESLEIIVFGSGTKTIGKNAFQSCTSLKQVMLNDGLETISSAAFCYCENLKSITIPESVITIENGAFLGIEKDLTIYGVAGSYAETYAKEAGIEFVAQ